MQKHNAKLTPLVHMNRMVYIQGGTENVFSCSFGMVREYRRGSAGWIGNAELRNEKE